ncbi:MAG: endonuclease [Bacteroidales bacterium]|nr:endonuclease [Bacteroidales bacterium]
MKRLYIFLLLLFDVAATLKAQAPSGYYDSANGLTGNDLRAALHNIIKNDEHVSYTPGIWNAYQTTDLQTGTNYIWDIYSDFNFTYSTNQCGSYQGEGDCYNREHLWAQSWTNSDATEQTDLHHIYPTDGYVNQQRGNYAFGEVNNATWTSHNGSKLGSCKTSLGYSGTVFEPIDEYKGDIARALMYVSVRYYGQDDNWKSDQSMTDKSNIKQWAIEMLLKWHHNDPVSEKEIARNNAVYGIQHNRNPFVDSPNYADMIWDPNWSSSYQIIASADPAVGGSVSVTYDFNESASIDFSAQGYSDATAISSATLDSNVGVTFNKGTNNNAPTYYTNGSAIRCYGGNNFTVSTALGSITNIVLTYGSSDGSNTITTDVGSFSNKTWTGDATSVTFTIGGTSGNRRLKGISVTYSDAGGPEQQVTAPAGAIATLTATPNIGYTFVNWTKDNAEVTKNPTYSFTVDAAGTYVANFQLQSFEIATIANPSYGGIAYIGEIPPSSVTKSIDFSAQGYENGAVVSNADLDENIGITFNQGTNSSNAPKYYDGGEAIRCYGGNNFVVSRKTGSNATITSIVLTFGSGEDSNTITTNTGTFNTNTWTGNSSSVTFTIGGTKGNRRIHAMSVTYSTGSGTPITVTTFNYGETASLTAVPNDGYFFTNWTENNTNTVVSTDASCEVTVTEDMTYQANFIPATISENTTIQSLTMGESKTLTINSGVTLTVIEIITQASDATILIKDGTNGMGQLVNSTANIDATVEKNITAWTTTPSKSGWHAISTPVNNVAFADVTNLRSSDYNVYRLNETNLTWENCNYNSNVFSSFDNGHGYIYRKGDSQTIAFNGDLNATDVTYPLTYTSSTTKGFHLIGNPYPHNIYKGDGAAIPNTYLEEGFYTITSAGGFVPGIDETTPIAPCEAILVQALNTVTDEDLIITKTTATGAKRDFDDNIMFAVSNSNYEDVAYAVFKKGHGLNKIEHRNEDIQMLYVQQNGEDFAIANIDENVQMFNLNFRAATTGKYTLKVKPTGDFRYLHLIDNLTGYDIDLLLDDEYSFIASLKDKENRFIVKFRRDDACIASNDEIFAYQNGNEIVVDGEGELQIFDVTGRLIITRHVNGVDSFEKPYQSGVYILRMIGEEIRIQKIIVK